MWQHNGWIDGEEADYAASHYGAYAHTTEQGLRIISINTDFWYPPYVLPMPDLQLPHPTNHPHHTTNTAQKRLQLR